MWNRGVSVAGGSKAEILNSEIRNCHYAGVTIGRGAHATIEGCRISGSAWHGIRYDDASPRIENNLIFRNARSGIYASGKTKAQVRHNLFYENEMNGISCWFENRDLIEANTFKDNHREALSILGASAPTIQSNIFSGHSIALYQGRIGGDQSSSNLGQPLLLHNVFWNNETNWFCVTSADAEGKPIPEVLELSAEAQSQAEDFPSALQQGLGAPNSVWADSPWPLQPEEEAIIPDGTTRDSTQWKRPDQ
jgi:parallel beta-helix repeat protein